MTDFIRSGAGGTPDGVDWTTAWLSIGAATLSAGETIYIAHDHNATGLSAQTITGGSAGAEPVYLLAVDDSSASSNYTAANTPAASTILTAPTAIEDSGSNAYTFSGNVYVQGVHVKFGANSVWGGSGDAVQVHRHSAATIVSTSTRTLTLGGDATMISQRFMMFNWNFTSCNNVGSGLRGNANGLVQWIGGTYGITTTQPTTALGAIGRGVNFFANEVDFSALTGTIVATSAVAAGRWYFGKCKFSDIADISNFASTEEGGETLAVGCGVGTSPDPIQLLYDTNVAQAYHVTAVYRTGGASFDGTAFSLRAQTKSSTTPKPCHGRQFRHRLGDFKWDDANSKIRVYLAQKDGKTRVKDNQAWIEAEFHQSGNALGKTQNSKATDYGPLDSGTAWTTDSGSTWNDSGADELGTTPVASYAEITPSGDVTGPMTVWLVIAADNSGSGNEYYVDPAVAMIA
jgi:hypothetical protein